MRILYHHRIGSKDGQYVHIEELTSALRRLGHDVRVVGPTGVNRTPFGADAGMVIGLKRVMPRAVYETLELLYSFGDYARLRRVARKYRPDAFYERYTLFLPSGVWLKKKLRIPMLLEVNAPLREERARYSGLALRRLASATERWAWSGADRVLPVTGVLAERVRRTGVPEERIVVIPNGVNLRRFRDVPNGAEAKRRLGLEGKLVLGFTGFVREWHRLERAVDLLRESGDGAERLLLVVGDGPAREPLEAYARRRGVENRLRFTGIVSRDRVAAHVAAFDVALQPDVVPYASPLKLFEYLAVGRAVVAPSTPNIREILTNKENAVLFDPSRSGSFGEAVSRLCADPGLRIRLGTAAWNLVEARGFTWDANARRVVALFEELGAGEGGSASVARWEKD